MEAAVDYFLEDCEENRAKSLQFAITYLAREARMFGFEESAQLLTMAKMAVDPAAETMQ